jgi:hypothetical protein
MGSAKDIVEHCGVPRFVFSDFPLGNSAGKPNDPRSQLDTLLLALDTVETAATPATTVQSPQTWSEDEKWKADFYSIANLSAAELTRRRAEFDQIKVIGQSVRDQTEQT